MGEGYIQRADLQILKEVFSKYASVTEGGEKFLTYEDFVVRFLKLLPEKNYNKETLALFGGILDQVLHDISYHVYLGPGQGWSRAHLVQRVCRL